MEGGEMNRGFSLLEVMITLVVIMLVFVATARISVVTAQSGRYSEALTAASVLGHTTLVRLKGLPCDSSDLESGWHQDPENPIEYGPGQYYRFWQVSAAAEGIRSDVHVAWDEGMRQEARNFGSFVELEQSGCPHISFSGIIR